MSHRVPRRSAFTLARSCVLGLCVPFCLMLDTAWADSVPSPPVQPSFNSVSDICDSPPGGTAPPVLNAQKFAESVVFQYKLNTLLHQAIDAADSKLDADLVQSISRGAKPDAATLSEQRRESHQNILIELVTNGRFCGAYASCSADEKKNQQEMARFVRTLLTPSSYAPQGSTGVTFVPPPKADINRYLQALKTRQDVLLQDSANYPLQCVPKGAPPWQQQMQNTTSAVLKHFMLRSVPDQLAVPVVKTAGQPAPVDLPHEQNNNYLSSNSAKFSFGQTGGTSAVTNNVVGTLGVPFQGGDLSALKDIALTPYIGMDRETKIQTTKGVTTTTFSANTLDYGLALSGDIGPSPGSELPWWFISVRPDYLRNYVDGSDILSVNTKFSPVFYGEYLPFNHLTNACNLATDTTLLRCMLQLDLRADVGWFMNYGHPAEPSLNHDYVRLGGLIGPQLEFDLLPNNPIDLAATYTDFYAARGFSKSLGLFQTSGTFNFDPSKIVGLTLQYSNGRRDDTAARVQLWSIGLTLHY